MREAALPPTVSKRRILALIAALLVGALAALFGLGTRTAETQTTPPAQAAYDVKDLGTLGGVWSYAYDVNDSGQVVGQSYISSGDNPERHAFLYEDGQMKDLGTLGGTYSAAYGINDAGQVVGVSHNSSGTLHAFLYENGQMKDLGTLGGSYGAAIGINEAGQVVGESTTSSNGVLHPFLYEDGQMKNLNTLVPQDNVGNLGEPRAINKHGHIALKGYNKDGDYRALLLTPTPEKQIQTLEETIQDLNLPSGTNTSLQSKLDDALSAVQAGDKAAACTALNDFVNHVEAQAGKKKISESEGQTLIEAAERIMTALGCQ